MTDDNFFREGSPFLRHPLLTAERTHAEIDFIEVALDLRARAHVLDVGCGFGRHSLELARRGYRVWGIDSSAAMIAAAEKSAAEEGLSATFSRLWGQDLVQDALFEAAICLFTTLGQIDKKVDNRGLITRVWHALKPGGYFVVEVPQRQTTVKQLRPTDRFGDDTVFTAVRRDYDPESQTVTEEFRVVNLEQTSRFVLSYHLFSREELEELLHLAGFKILRALGSYDAEPLLPEHATMLFIAQKN